MKYNSILDVVGHTPVVCLRSFNDHIASALWVKLESFNPGGSVKDRPALNMIEDAERKKKQTINSLFLKNQNLTTSQYLL